MSTLHRALNWVFGWLNIEGSETICAVGMLPPQWNPAIVFARIPDTVWAHEYSRLASVRRFSKRRIGVLYVGIGNEGRGLLLRQKKPDGNQYLTSDWWRDLEKDISLVAFSCHSAPLLRESRTIANLTHAVAYASAIWLPDDNGEYWADFLAKLQAALRAADGEASELYAAVQAAYVNAIRRSNASLSYLTRQCLVQQSSTVELLYGAKL
jgi:hypothetical protein